MRAPVAFLTLLIAVTAPAIASEPSSREGHKKAVHVSLPAARRSDLLPMPDLKPRDHDLVHEPLGGDKSLHYGNVTITPGRLLDVGTGGGSRD